MYVASKYICIFCSVHYTYMYIVYSAKDRFRVYTTRVAELANSYVK